MNIHEYQAKKILSQYGISIPKGMMPIPRTKQKKLRLRFRSAARGC